MGSRFGGLKQVQPVGPAGELIIEYSVFDAMRAGFERAVLVIRRDLEDEFRAGIGRRLEQHVAVEYVFQKVDDLPSGAKVAPGRTKPWGTGHAVWAARHAVRAPFAVINADDFYGASGYVSLAHNFAQGSGYAMVGYPLKQTLSEHGTVSRGLCTTDGAGRLQKITEVTKIEPFESGARYTEQAGHVKALSGDETVSMNFWGFTPAVFPQLERLLGEFLARSSSNPKAEFYLPTALSTLNEQGESSIALLRSEDEWFGLTYREDVTAARAAITRLVANGRYPAPLWG